MNVGLARRPAGRLGRGDVSLINISPSGTCQELLRLRQAYHSLDTRLAHLSPLQYTGPHKPFDLHHKITIRHQPNAFLKTILPTHEDCMSQHQMSLYLKLILGLPIPSILDSSFVCPCVQIQDFHGYHRLNCKQNAGRANRAAHDLVQLALKKKLQRLDLRVVDNDNEMCKQFSHLSSQKQGDLAILSASNFLIFDSVSSQPRLQAIADIKTVSLVNSQGTWTTARSCNKNKIKNPGLDQQEQIKTASTQIFYAPIGFAFFPFVVSCFGSFETTALWCLFAVADLEARQLESLLIRQDLLPMDPSACSQFRAIWYLQLSSCCRQGFHREHSRSSSSSIAAAHSVCSPCSELPWPGRYSFSPPFPLIFAYSLSSLPSPSLPSSTQSPALSP